MLRLLAIPIGLFALLAAALVYSGGAEKKQPEFSFINRGDIFTLDLNEMSYMQDFRLTYGIREGLYGVEPDTLKPIPAGATDCVVSDDKKVWTFHLRKGAKWSNGDLCTARDYLFSWRRMLEDPGEYTYLFYYIKNAEAYKDAYAAGKPVSFSTVGAEAPDDLTVRVTLINPVPYLLEIVSFPPYYPRHERSMAPFRIFIDSSDRGDDVMDVFDRCLKAAKDIDPSGSPQDVAKRFAAAAENPALANVATDKLNAWLDTARRFVTKEHNLDELLTALAVFQKLDPFVGVTSKVDAAGGDALGGLQPAEKLKAMLAAGFVRYNYNKAYTVPPAVVTNGPYVLSEWLFRRRLLLTKSENYWDKANVRVNTIQMDVINDASSQLLSYLTGQVQWNADVAGDQAAELKAQGNKDLRASPAFGTAFISLLCSPELPPFAGSGKNPCADIRVRQALAMSIDKQFIVDKITRMDELPARTYLPPDGTLPKFTFRPGPADPAGTKPYDFKQLQKSLRSPTGLTGPGPGLAYNPQRARELLAEAGFPGGKGFPRLPVLFNSENTTRRDFCQTLQSQWKKELGIDVELKSLEGPMYNKQTHAKDYWISTAAWYGDYPDASTFTDKYQSRSLQNDALWNNATYDALCESATSEPDEEKRMVMLSKAEDLIDTEVPIIPLYHYVNTSLSPDWVHGVLPNPRGVTVLKGLWLDKDHGGKGK